MIAAVKHATRFILIGLLAALSACGGGADDGPSVSVSPSSLTFYATDVNMSTPAAQSFTLTLSGGNAWLGGISVNGAAISTFNYSFPSGTTAEIQVFPASPLSLGAGTHTGSVVVEVCADAYCNSQIAGSPFVVGVTYLVGGFSASQPTIYLNAVEGESPVAVSETISHSTISAAWTASAIYSGAPTGWATLSAVSGAAMPATLSVGATPMSAGVYTSTMQFWMQGNTLDVPIIYTVAKAMAPAPSALNFTIGNSVTSADLSRSVTVGSNYPSGSPKTINWSATTDVPWLSVNPLAGNSSSQPLLTATLVTAQVNALLNGTYSGNINLSSSSPSVSALSIPVTLTVNRSQINYVSPYVASANTSAQVIIRGNKFSQVTVQNVKFGGVSASTFQVVSDTEIRATHPALAAGQYPVSAVTASGNLASRATLVVTNPVALTDLTFLHYAGVNKKLIYDPERNVVLAIPNGADFIERHIFNGADWVSANTTLPFIRNGGAMSPDGKELVVLTYDNRILRLDAVTLAELSATAIAVYPYYLKNIAALNDENFLVEVGSDVTSRLYLFNLFTQSFTLVANSALSIPLVSINVAGDGRHALLQYDNWGTSGSDNLYSYDAGTGQFAPIAQAIAGPINNLSRNGARILSNNSNVYDASLTLLGSLPYYHDAVHNDCVTPNENAVISPNGTRAYAVCYSSFTAAYQIYTYDLAAAPVNGFFPVIGSFKPAQPSLLLSTQIAGDGKTLFLKDYGQVIMVPLP